MAIDYFGTLLSITGCVLLILPLIWVRDESCRNNVSRNTDLHREVLRFPGIRLRYWRHCSAGSSWLCFSLYGSGREHVYPSCLVGHFDSIERDSTYLIPVYIFKHVTVSGVYITMFAKYVTSSSKLLRFLACVGSNMLIKAIKVDLYFYRQYSTFHNFSK